MSHSTLDGSAASPTPFPKIISVDDHVVEPPNIWQDRLPRKYLDVGPRVERRRGRGFFVADQEYTFEPDDQGFATDIWRYEDLVLPMRRTHAAVGHDRDWVTMTGVSFDELRPGCYDPIARLADMDENWVEASLCFPNVLPRFCGQTFYEAKDHELALLCVRAYNDWMVDEWSAPTKGRLIPLCLVPLWDAEEAAKEVRRNAARGVRTVTFTELPTNLGLPSIHSGFWDPFILACEETSTVICMHIGSGSKLLTSSDDAPRGVGSTLLTSTALIVSLVDWLMSGLFERYPQLTIAYSEGQVGWVPYFLHRADKVWLENRGYNEVYDRVHTPPSQQFRAHVYGCVFDDPHGFALIDEIGVDNVTFESDYPHSDSTWPNTRKFAEEQTAGLPTEVIEKVMRGNAIRMLGLEA